MVYVCTYLFEFISFTCDNMCGRVCYHTYMPCRSNNITHVICVNTCPDILSHM